VYDKLADMKGWNNWHKSAWVLCAPGQSGKLKTGDVFSYSAPFVLGNVKAEVTAASPNKV
jgi:hypothetical protein